MDKKEKAERKAKLSQYVNLGNGRFKNYEIERLESIVENRNELDGKTKTYSNSYKSFDSEDTYNVKEKDSYTFHKDDNDTKISIERNFERHWDDGQTDTSHEIYDTARDILNLTLKIFDKHNN